MRKYWKQCTLLCCVVALAGTAFWQIGNRKKPEIRKYSAFFSVLGQEIDEDNEIKKKIAELTGAECEEIWLVGQTSDQAIASYIAGGEYPDFISGNIDLYEANALIPVDEYWDEYPNLRSYFTDSQWELLKQEDGHIYWIPQFGNQKNPSEDILHNGEAFWIQTRVLKWAKYPEIRTLEEYFNLIEAYVDAHPLDDLVPYTVLCDDWRYFCLENVPQFLDGYPNDGCCIVNPNTLKVEDYNTTATARKYYRILNEEFQKGILDPEFYTQTYSEYLEKLATGRVLGMSDQWWQFYYTVDDMLRQQGEGMNYVPLPITIDRNVQNKWHTQNGTQPDVSGGISVTVSCKDVKGAFQFLNDLLREDIQKLRFWGIEGVDYEVDENGLFYLTEEQRDMVADSQYKNTHFCSYAYFPRLEGNYEDGINAFSPEFQPEEFYAALPEDVKECLSAYGCNDYVDMLGNHDIPGEWFPVYAYADILTTGSEAGLVWKKMDQVKREYLPQLVMTDDFDSIWEKYMESYESVHPEIFFAEMQKVVDERTGNKSE